MAETNHVCDVSRRSFVKGSLTAAVGAGAASWLTGCSPKPVADTGGTESEPTPVVEDNDEIFRGTCRCNCYGGCYLNIHVRDGKIVRTSMRDLPETALSSNPLRYQQSAESGTASQRAWYPG